MSVQVTRKERKRKLITIRSSPESSSSSAEIDDTQPPAKHGKQCCEGCRSELADIKQTLQQMQKMLQNMQQQLHNRLDPGRIEPDPEPHTGEYFNLPITTEEGLQHFEKMLNESAVARTQYITEMEKIGGKTAAKNTRNILSATVSPEMAYKLCWSRSKNRIVAKHLKCFDILIETILKIWRELTRDEALKVVKRWQQTASDRLPKY